MLLVFEDVQFLAYLFENLLFFYFFFQLEYPSTHNETIIVHVYIPELQEKQSKAHSLKNNPPLKVHLPMELEQGTESEDSSMSTHWPLEPIDLKRLKFPCCLVWTPLPVVSWLAPYMGHVGICREDGTVLDFFGSNLVNVGDFGYGTIARYLPLNRNKVLTYILYFINRRILAQLFFDLFWELICQMPSLFLL